MGMVQDTHPKHMMYQLFSEPADFGFGGLARLRTWVIGAHEDRSTCLHDPHELLRAITDACQAHQTSVSSYLVANKHEIALESQELAQKRGVVFQPENSDLTYLLTVRELEAKQYLDVKYHQSTNSPPESNKDLIYFLGDNPWSYSASWSATSGMIPTFRRNAASGIFWIPREKRFLTQKEKLVSMGWPVCPEISKFLKVPLCGVSDVRRASDLLGNAMHFHSSAILQLVALSCFGPN